MKRVLMLLVGIIAMSISQSHADAVIDWNATAITVMLKVPALASNPNTDMAYVHIAIYDAVNAIDGRYSVFAVAPSNAAPWASKEAATAAAARRVLLTFYSSQQAYIDSVYAAALARLPDDSSKTRGVAIGDTVATRFLALRAGDGRDASIAYTWLTPGPGVYQPTPPGAAQYQPLNPWVADLRPFSLNSPSQFRAPGPPPLTSDVYTRDFNEVKRYGSRDSSFTTAQQREIARFHTENPNVQLARNIRLFAASRGMSLADNARLFAQLYVTIGDALITGWDSKYLYNNWRPSTAIHEADVDGNPLTARDTSWLPLVNTPTHPEYVAAHGCALGSFACTLEKFFGTTNVPVTLTSAVTGVPHSFTNTNEIITETVNARVYGGMHFRSSVEDGVTIARSVAAWVARRHFIRLNASPWTLQRAPGLPFSLNPDVVLSAVNENVCWGSIMTNSQYLRTTNGGTNWTVSAITGATGSLGASITALDANTAWVASTGGVFKTLDGGSTWEHQATAFSGSGGYPNIIHFFDSDNGVCAGDPKGGYWDIYTTTNGGTNWTRVPSANIPPPLAGETGAANDAQSVGNNFWFGTFSGSLYRTTDRGMTWTVARNIIGGEDGFGFAFKDNSNGLACTFVDGNRISRTSDGGTNWTPILPLPSGLSGLSTYYVSCAKGTSGSYVITSNNNIGGPISALPGSAYSTDSGVTWTQMNTLPLGRAEFLSDRVGWSGGLNDSIYKWDNNLLIASVRQSSGIAEGFRLEQNYPNPFNPSTKIRFEIRDLGYVSLKIYDVLGREVTTLVNEVKQPGSYEATFDARGLASGVYLYRLKAGSFTETKRLLLLR